MFLFSIKYIQYNFSSEIDVFKIKFWKKKVNDQLTSLATEWPQIEKRCSRIQNRMAAM
jgi:hypothetical protein